MLPVGIPHIHDDYDDHDHDGDEVEDGEDNNHDGNEDDDHDHDLARHDDDGSGAIKRALIYSEQVDLLCLWRRSTSHTA